VRNRAINFIICTVFVCFVFLFTFKINGNVEKFLSETSLKQSILSINSFLEKSFKTVKTGDIGDTAPEKNDKKSDLSGILLFLLNSMAIVSPEKLIFILLLTAAVLSRLIGFKDGHIVYKSVFKPPDLSFYKWWSLKFLSPLQKCLYNRSDEYDINPIYMLDGGVYVSNG